MPLPERPTFTVCTPTYNRGPALARVWESLRVQTWRDFEWLVIDDGSTDNTRELVESWMAQSDFPIRYLWQRNQHKKVAMNLAAREARGELFLGFDSDDSCVPDALERFWKIWNCIPESEREGFVGVTGLCAFENGEIVGDRYPCEDYIDSTGSEIQHRYRVLGEKWGFTRTDVLRQYPFPQDVKGYVPEGYVWRQIEMRYRTRFVNQVMRTYFRDCDDSLMTTGKRAPYLDSDGCTLGFAMELRTGVRWFRFDPFGLAKLAANLVRQALHSTLPWPRLVDELWTRQTWPARLLLLAAAPVGCAVWCLDRLKADPEKLRAHREAARAVSQAAQA